MQIIINDTDACWAEVLDVLSGARVTVAGAPTGRTTMGVPAEQYLGLSDTPAAPLPDVAAVAQDLGRDFMKDIANMAERQIDAQGIPWDQRIHASSKAKTADGNWRVKRNVAPELVAQITAELKGAMGLPAPAPAPVALVVVPPAPPAPVAPPPPPAAPAIVVDPFNDLMTYITGRQAAKTITAAKVMEVVKAQGFDSLMTLAQRPDLIPTLRAALEKVTG